jgi:predicted DCC family thiol-disulfide oxidoreductase YuxK
VLTRPVLLYDGDCTFCRRWVRRLRRADREGRIVLLPAAEQARVPGLPPFDPAALQRAMHLILPDGTVLTGARAAPAILRLLPRGKAIAWLLAMPGVRWVADRIYGWIAARRHRFGCGPGRCGSEPP